MKTLFTAEAIAKGGRSETNQTPNGCRTSHSGNSEEITRAKDIFKQAGAQDICVTGDASAPTGNKATEAAPYKAS
jgi:fructoselysine-6-P-deglycase FrlB-like protein